MITVYLCTINASLLFQSHFTESCQGSMESIKRWNIVSSVVIINDLDDLEKL